MWETYLKNKQNNTDKPYYTLEGAQDLNISEGLLVSQNPHAKFLGADIQSILLELENMGLIESIVRNKAVVHEKTAILNDLRFINDHIALAVNVGGLDLRYFIRHFSHAIAIQEFSHGKENRSIQFFDKYGRSLQKIFLRNSEAISRWDSFIQANITHTAPVFEDFTQSTVDIQKLPASQVADFHHQWMNIKDIHEFNKIIASFSIDRITAYESAPKDKTKKINQSLWKSILQRIAETELEVMIFAGNTGVVQIQTGKVHHVVEAKGYLNILDKSQENFNLHFKVENISETWLVRRPTEDGEITCFEAFDHQRQSVLQIFGKRREGETENSQWREFTNQFYALRE